jgi:hypothetical protein
MSEIRVLLYGLNLTDHYWIHNEEDNLEWKSLNFFDNIFDKLKVGNIANPDKEK